MLLGLIIFWKKAPFLASDWIPTIISFGRRDDNHPCIFLACTAYAWHWNISNTRMVMPIYYFSGQIIRNGLHHHVWGLMQLSQCGKKGAIHASHLIRLSPDPPSATYCNVKEFQIITRKSWSHPLCSFNFFLSTRRRAGSIQWEIHASNEINK